METVPTPDNLEAFAGLIIKAIQGGQWAALVALGIVAAVWTIRKFLGPQFPALEQGRGGAILNLLASFGSGLAAAATGVPFSWAMVLSVLWALVSAGGFSLVKSLITGRGDAPALIAASEKAGLAAATAASSPKAQDIVNGP